MLVALALRGEKPADLRENVLLFGNPGIGKSFLLQTTEELYEELSTISTSQSTERGLTAGIKAENKEYRIEPGALALSNGGVLALEEINTLEPEEQKALLEPLSSGKVKITKVIKATFPAQTSVIFTCNPSNNRMVSLELAPSEQTGLISAFLSRIGLKLYVNPPPSSRIREAFLRRRRGETKVVPYSTDLIKSILVYSRSFDPILPREMERIFADAQEEIMQSYQITDNRQIKTFYNLAEAFARLDLSSEITEKHIKLAHLFYTEVLEEWESPPKTYSSITSKEDSFTSYLTYPEKLDSYTLESQNVSSKSINVESFAMPDNPVTESSISQLLLDELTRRGGVEIEHFINSHNLNAEEVDEVISKLKRAGEIFEPIPGTLKLL